MYKIIGLLLGLLLAIVALSGGGLQQAHGQSVEALYDKGYDCFNYEINLNMMFDLQSRYLRSKGWTQKIYAKKINKLRPSLINNELLCIGSSSYMN